MVAVAQPQSSQQLSQQPQRAATNETQSIIAARFCTNHIVDSWCLQEGRKVLHGSARFYIMHGSVDDNSSADFDVASVLTNVI